MPFEPSDPLGGFVDTAAIPEPENPDRPFSEVLGAALRTENTVGSFLSAKDRGFDGTEIDDDLDVFGEIRGTKYEEHFDAFAHVRNREHLEAVKMDVDREMNDRRILDEAGGAGFAAMMAAGVFDLPTLLPGGALVRTAKTGHNVLRIAGTTALAGGIDATLSEAALQSNQKLRTGTESALNIGGSVVLSGVIGAGAGALMRRAADDAADRAMFADANRVGTKIEKDMDIPADDAVDAFTPGSVRVKASAGAAAVDEADNTLKSAFGVEKVARYQDPMLRLQTSTSERAREHVQELAETPILYEKSARGEATAPLGSSLGQSGAVETRIKFWNAPLSDAVNAVDDAFVQYRKGRSKRVGDIASISFSDRIRGVSDMSYKDFKTEISRALRRDDVHEVPEVQKAAQFIRSKVLDPLKDEAIAAKLLDEDVDVSTALSYLNRVYDRERIIADRANFKTKITNWLRDTETNNEGVRSTLRPLLKDHKRLEKQIKKLEKQIKRREDTAGKVDARREEVSRFNKFAYNRAVRLSEPIDVVRTRIDGIAEKIQDRLDALEEINANIRNERENFPELQDVEGRIQKLSRSLSSIRKGADLDEMTDGAQEIGDGIAEISKRLKPILATLRERAREIRGGDMPEGKNPEVDEMLSLYKALKDNPNPKRPVTLTEIIAHDGIRDTNGDVRSMLGTDNVRIGIRQLIREDGKSPDEWGETLWEMGYFPERPTPAEVLDLLETDFRGNHVYSPDDLGLADEFEFITDARSQLQSLGVDAKTGEAEARRLIIERLTGEPPEIALLTSLERDRSRLGKEIRPFRKRLAELRREQKALEKRNKPRAREGAVFETNIRNRGNTLADQSSGKRGDIDALKTKLDAKRAEFQKVQQSIEENVTKHQGKTSNEARSAVTSRTNREAETFERTLTVPDLKSADKSVMKAARALAKQDAKDDTDLDDLADQIIDRVLGTPDGRLPYDAHKAGGQGFNDPNLRGPLKSRVFNIPDELIEEYLENDVEHLLRVYTRTMASDVEIAKRFGSVDMVDQIKEIAEEYNAKMAKAETPKQREKLQKQKDADIRDLAGIRDRLRGTYAMPSDPNSMIVRSSRAVRSLNYLRLLGGMQVSAIPDMARPVMVHGFARVFRDGLVPMFTNFSAVRLAGNEVKAAGTALDMTLDSRTMAIADIMDDYGRGSKFERGLHSATSNFGVVSLMAPWNAWAKQFSGMVSMTRILQSAEDLAAGKISKSDLEAMSSAGISEDAARSIAREFEAHGSKEGGVWLPNTEHWNDRAAVDAFRAALVRDVDRIVVTPGQDKPLFMSTELGRTIGQFKSFAIASTQRTLIAGLQQRDAAVLNGALLAITLGGMVHIAKGKLSGYEVETDFKKEGALAQFMVNAFDRSGLPGWLMEANNMTEKLTRGGVGLSAITGKQVSRYSSRNVIGAMIGPTAGTITDFAKVTGAAFTNDFKKSDVRAMRRLLPYQNLFYMRSMLDQAEAGVTDYFGIEGR